MHGRVESNNPLDDADQSSSQNVMKGLLPRSNAWQFLVYIALILGSGAAILSLWDPYTRLPGLPWALGLFLLCTAAFIHDRANGLLRWRLSRTDLLLIAGLTLAAFALRLHRLDDFLPPLHGDEGEMGIMAMLVRHGPENGMPPLPLFSTAWLGHPTLFHYLQAAALLLFGDHATALRLLSVFFGTLCIPVIYLIGLVGWSRIAAIAAAWLMAVSHLYIHYSRIALNNIETVWLTLLFVLMLAILFEAGRGHNSVATRLKRGLPGQRPAVLLPLLPAVVAGMAVGLGQYFYFGSRLMVILLPLMILAMSRGSRINLSQLAICGCAIYIACVPLAAYYSRNWPALLDRMQGVSIFSSDGMRHALDQAGIWPDDTLSLLVSQVYRNLSFFVRSGDYSAFYLPDLPAFDVITVILAWTGLVLAVVHCRRYHERALLLLLGVGIVLGGILTIDAPNGPRLIVSAAGMFLLAGVTVHHGYRLVEHRWPHAAPASLVVTLAPIAAVTFFLNYHTYFIQYVHLAAKTTVITIAHEIAAERQHFTPYLLTAPSYHAQNGIFRFVAYGVEVQELDSSQIESLGKDIRARNGQTQPLMFFFIPSRMADLPVVEAQFPNGKTDKRFDASGRLLYAVYRMPH